MKRDDIEFQLSQLLDGQLDDATAEALRRRMAREPALAEQFRRYRALQEAMEAQTTAPTVDWDVQRESIHARLERVALLAARRPPVMTRIFRWSAAVTAAAAMVAGILLTLYWLAKPASPGRVGTLEVAVVRPVAPAARGTVRASTLTPADAGGRLEVIYNPDGQAPTAVGRGPRGIVIVSTDPKSPAAAAWALDEL